MMTKSSKKEKKEKTKIKENESKYEKTDFERALKIINRESKKVVVEKTTKPNKKKAIKVRLKLDSPIQLHSKPIIGMSFNYEKKYCCGYTSDGVFFVT